MLRAGLEGRGIVPHVLRNTFATHFPGHDVDLQRMLGHKDIQTTMIYRRNLTARTREAVDRMDFETDHTPSTRAAAEGE